MRLRQIQRYLGNTIFQIKAQVLPDDLNGVRVHQGGGLVGELQRGSQGRHQIIALEAHVLRTRAAVVIAGCLPKSSRHSNTTACRDGDGEGQVQHPLLGQGFHQDLIQSAVAVPVLGGAGEEAVLLQQLPHQSLVLRLREIPEGAFLPAAQAELLKFHLISPAQQVQHIGQGGLPAGDGAGHPIDLLVTAAVGIPLEDIIADVITQDDQDFCFRLSPDTVGNEIAVLAPAPVRIPTHAVEAVGEDCGGLWVGSEGHRLGSGVVFLMGRGEIRELIYSHRDLRGSSFLHRPGQVFSVCQKCLIIGPFVRRGQVPGGAVRLPGVLKASGVAAGEHRETGPPAIHGDSSVQLGKVQPAGGDGVEGVDRHTAVSRIGQRVAVCHLGPPLSGGSILIGAGGKIPGDGPPCGQAGVRFRRGQRKDRPGVGQEGSARAVAVTAGFSTGQRGISGAAGTRSRIRLPQSPRPGADHRETCGRGQKPNP